MNQHAIPQNVTGYQFHLIGDMTIQQFVYLSVGVGAAIFFYYTNLFSLIKWFFVLLSTMTGFAIAFLPLEERPLDQWIVNYIKAIYRPTRFMWRKAPKSPDYFSFTPNTSVLPNDSEDLARAAAIRRQRGLQSYLVTLPNDQQLGVDQQEKSSLNSVLNLFTAPSTNPTNQPEAVITVPVNPQPVVESMHVQPPVAVTEVSAPPAIAIEEPFTPSVAATTSASLPFPSTPSTPNTIVGMVLDSANKIVDNAIVEVVDETGLPVRATKTNQLGQFFSTTPLRRGIYHITVEKTGYTFDTIELTLSGQIIDPLKIIAKV